MGLASFFEGEGGLSLPYPRYGLLCWAIYPRLSSRDVKALGDGVGGGFSGWDMGQREAKCALSLSLSLTHVDTYTHTGPHTPLTL